MKTNSILSRLSPRRPLFLLALLLLGTAVLSAVFSAHTPPAAAGSSSLTYLPIIQTPRQFEANPLPQTFPYITDIVNAGDDRLFITSKTGVIYVMQANGSVSVFLDITSRVISSGSEEGLLGLAFDPDYANNGYFYVSYIGSYTGTPKDQLLVSRFAVTGNPNVADPGSEIQIFRVEQDFDPHNGGALRFNPLDDYLYVGVGDDSQLLVAQSSSGFKGRIVRLDTASLLTQDVQTLKPLIDTETVQAVVPTERWAKGLRNPWRIAFDVYSGGMFIGDVGASAYEEINYIPNGVSGLNFGWPCLEGPNVVSQGGQCGNPNDYVKPLYYYPHQDLSCAIIGGDVVRLGGTPASPQRYIFGDACNQKIFTYSNESGVWEAKEVGRIDAPPGILTSFGMSQDGRIFAGTYSNVGKLYELYIP